MRERLLDGRIPRGDIGVLEVERNVQGAKAVEEGVAGCGDGSVGADGDGRGGWNSAYEVDGCWIIRTQYGSSIGWNVGVVGASLDGIVVGVRVIDEGNVADAESSSEHRGIGGAIGGTEPGCEVGVIGLHPEVRGVSTYACDNELVGCRVEV